MSRLSFAENLSPLTAPQETPAPVRGSVQSLFSLNFICKVWQGAWAHLLPTPELGHHVQIGWDQVFMRLLPEGAYPSSGVIFFSSVWSFSLPLT